MTEKFMMAGSTALHVCDSEQGERCIVLLHGYLESLLVWDDFVPLLYKQLRVVTLDLPGTASRSLRANAIRWSSSPTRWPKASRRWASSAARLVGHSMGGCVALAFCERHPDMLDGLVLLSSTPNPDTEEKAENRRREIALRTAGKKEMLARVRPAAGFAEENRTRMADAIEDLTEQVFVTEEEGNRRPAQRHDRPQGSERDAAPDEGSGALHSRAQGQLHPRGGGREDGGRPSRGARVVWLEHSGHMGFLEEPEATAKALLDFVARDREQGLRRDQPRPGPREG